MKSAKRKEKARVKSMETSQAENSGPLSRLSSQYAKNGIVFSLPYFCLALMILPKPEEVPGFAQLEQTHLLARNNAASAFSNLGICYSL